VPPFVFFICHRTASPRLFIFFSAHFGIARPISAICKLLAQHRLRASTNAAAERGPLRLVLDLEVIQDSEKKKIANILSLIVPAAGLCSIARKI